MADEEEEEAPAEAEPAGDAPPAAAVDAAPIADTAAMDAIYDISVDVTAVLGTATMKVSQLLKMGRGAVVQLDRMVNEEIDITCKGLLIARGDVVVVDENLGVSLTKIVRTNIAKV